MESGGGFPGDILGRVQGHDRLHGRAFHHALAGGPLGDLAALTLVGFNGGVELGQLAVVSAFLPVAYVLRASWLYRRLVFAGGSAAIALVASIWLAERVFDFKLL
jgi:hypothetical protein